MGSRGDGPCDQRDSCARTGEAGEIDANGTRHDADSLRTRRAAADRGAVIAQATHDVTAEEQRADWKGLGFGIDQNALVARVSGGSMPACATA